MIERDMETMTRSTYQSQKCWQRGREKQVLRTSLFLHLNWAEPERWAHRAKALSQPRFYACGLLFFSPKTDPVSAEGIEHTAPAAMEGIGGKLAAAVLKAAAGKVGAAAGNRIMLQWRFKKDLEYMRDTLESMEAVLEDAERQSMEDKSVLLWLQRLTRASYDICDILDKFEVDTIRKSFLLKVRVCLFNNLAE
jgi:hypothetical protein